MLSIAKIYEEQCVQRYQVYLDTGYHDARFNRGWDMLAWLDAFHANPEKFSTTQLNQNQTVL